MITGNINETNKLKQRFLELNGFTNFVESSHYFNETYQSLYALRVIIRYFYLSLIIISSFSYHYYYYYCY